MFKKLRQIFALVLGVCLCCAGATPVFATPISAIGDGRAAITPPAGTTPISNLLDLCLAVDGATHLAGDDACADVFSSSDTVLSFSDAIFLQSGVDLSLSGLSLSYVDGPFSPFAFSGGSLVVDGSYYGSSSGCIFTLRDINDPASPYNQSTDELLLLSGTFEYTGSASGDYATSPICIMTGYKSKSVAFDYALLFLPENYGFYDDVAGRFLTADDLTLGLFSINKDAPASVYFFNTRKISIRRHPDEIPDDPIPSDPTPEEPEPSDPTPETPSDDQPSETQESSPEVTVVSSISTPKTPDTSGGSCENEIFLETIASTRLSSTSFFLLVALALTTYLLIIVIFTTLYQYTYRLFVAKKP